MNQKPEFYIPLEVRSMAKQKISRRRFIQGVGTGILGSTVAVHTLKALPPENPPDERTGAKERISLKVNGKPVEAWVEPRTTLAEFLRNELQLTGTKVMCNRGECGGCTVLLDGRAIYSCHFLAVDADGHEVTTIEGLMDGEKLHPIQEAFIEHDGFQCGFCTPGQIMAAQALLLKHPNPTREQVVKGMSGNLCRCASYPNIIRSVLGAAEKVKNSGS